MQRLCSRLDMHFALTTTFCVQSNVAAAYLLHICCIFAAYLLRIFAEYSLNIRCIAAKVLIPMVTPTPAGTATYFAAWLALSNQYAGNN
jgi:hypothetical protein